MPSDSLAVPGGPLVGRRRFAVTAGLAVLAACGGSSSRSDTTDDPSRSSVGPRASRLRTAGPDLALADGFEYAVLASTVDGSMPPAPDGMGCFAMPDGSVRLVRNHERNDPPDAASALDAASAYDPVASGGTTTLILRPDLRSVVGSHVSLSGTVQNCSGGATPWGSWLSCEETNEGQEVGRGQPHGYVFEVVAAADGPAVAIPLRALGRFLHEAVAVDPASGVVFLTEDNGYDSGLYRFIPATAGRLAGGGTLEMLAIADQPGYDTSFDQRVGQRLPVTWVPILDPDPATAGTDSSAVFNQGFEQGGARFKRVEGCCLIGSTWYVSATEAGDAGLGQVWAYDRATSELRLVLEAQSPEELFGPDNLAPMPGGDAVMIGEDNGNGEPNRLHLLGSDGRLTTFAENIADTTEFSGLCSSPDGSTLFVNVYGDEATGVPGRTLAVWGPWDTLT